MSKWIAGVLTAGLAAFCLYHIPAAQAADIYVESIVSSDGGNACSAPTTVGLPVRGSMAIQCTYDSHVAVGFSNPDAGSPAAAATTNDVIVPAGALYDIALRGKPDNVICQFPADAGPNTCRLYMPAPQPGGVLR